MVLPLRDVNPTRRRPYLTVGLLLANVAVFLLVQPHDGACPEAAFVYEWAAVPRELLELRDLTAGELEGVLGGCARQVGDQPVLLTVVTAMFLHGNLMHLLGNMLYLWVFGNNVEDRLGHVRFALFYLGGGAVATYVFAVLHSGSITPLLGASGAIAAILGAYLLLHPRAQLHAIAPWPLYLAAIVLPGIRITRWFVLFAVVTLPAWVLLSLWFVLQWVSASNATASTGVAFEAHVAGFLAGIVLLWLLDRERSARGRSPFHQRW